MKTVELTQNKLALVDDEDYDLLSSYKWYAVKMASNFGPRYYAATKTGGKRLFMHRLLLKTEMPHIDHIDGNSLNNQRDDLRPSTVSANIINSKLRIDNKTGYKNITAQ